MEGEGHQIWNIPCNQVYYDTVIIPVGVTQVRLEAWGGGGGGTGNQSNYVGQGGGGGAYAVKYLNVIQGDTLSFAVGGGGCGGGVWNQATSGIQTMIKLNGATLVSANGGQGSYFNGSNRVRGLGSSSVNCIGGAGSASNGGNGGANGAAGSGGAAILNSYSGGNGGSCASWSNGNPGQLRGGGGAGGGTGGDHAGGQGGDGFARISW